MELAESDFIRLSNSLKIAFDKWASENNGSPYSAWAEDLSVSLLATHLGLPYTQKYYLGDAFAVAIEVCRKSESWVEACKKLMNVIEYVFRESQESGRYDTKRLSSNITMQLDSEISQGYLPLAFTKGTFHPLINSGEVDQMAKVLNNRNLPDFVYEPLSAAFKELSLTGTRDLGFATQRAISALEAHIRHKAGSSKDFGHSLSALAKVNPSQDLRAKNMLEGIWGWASNEPGVRHGIPQSEKVTQELATFVIVQVSGLINLLDVLYPVNIPPKGK